MGTGKPQTISWYLWIKLLIAKKQQILAKVHFSQRVWWRLSWISFESSSPHISAPTKESLCLKCCLTSSSSTASWRFWSKFPRPASGPPMSSWRHNVQKLRGRQAKKPTWNAKCPICLGNFTPKTSNFCLKNSALGFPGIWTVLEVITLVCFSPKVQLCARHGLLVVIVSQ